MTTKTLQLICTILWAVLFVIWLIEVIGNIVAGAALYIIICNIICVVCDAILAISYFIKWKRKE